MVSVPSRGLSYLNEILSMMDETGEVVSVPSRGLSYLNINPNIFYSDFSQSGFRPLTGTLLSKRKGYKNESYQIIRVSVPSRGLSYLNKNYLTVEEVIACFRPLTGTLLSKLDRKDKLDLNVMFPSPHGDSLI